jgi:hypothetical protein
MMCMIDHRGVSAADWMCCITEALTVHLSKLFNPDLLLPGTETLLAGCAL